MKRQRSTNRSGFTLIELMMAMVTGVIVVFGMGIVLVDNQKGWHDMYNRVYSDVVTDGYVTKRAFDGVVRKSSVNERRPTVDVNGDYVEVYYYNDSSSVVPDRYAKFYTGNGTLLVDYGDLDSITGAPQTASATITLAHNVAEASFSVLGTGVRMVVSIDNGTEAITLVSLAVRHNK